MFTQEEVQKRLETACKARGAVALIARAIGCDQRTVRAALKGSHAINIATHMKLSDYFKKEDRRNKV